MVDASLVSVGAAPPPVEAVEPVAASGRISVRLLPDDLLWVRERAVSRSLPTSTYISLLVRAHLRSLAPLPNEELAALKRSVAELGAIGRNLNQIARHLNQGGGGGSDSSGPARPASGLYRPARSREIAHQHELSELAGGDMKRRLVSLRGEEPLLDIVSYGRGGVRLTSAQRADIARTIGRIPEVMVKVSGGARTLAGVEQHLKYISRDGNQTLETDDGDRNGKHLEQDLARDWDLDLEAYERQTERSIRGRRPPKLVHNLIFSMPPGTPPDTVLKAARTLVVNECALKHRYAMVLHTDDDHHTCMSSLRP